MKFLILLFIFLTFGTNKNNTQDSNLSKLVKSYDELTNTTDQFYFLENAIIKSNLDIVKYAIDNGFPVNCIDPYYERNLLHISANNGEIEIFDYLMSKGADINHFTCNDVTGWLATPLIFTVYSDQVDTTKHILENYSDQITNINDITANILNTSLRRGKFLILQYIVDEYQEQLKPSDIFVAIDSMDTNILEFIYKKGITNLSITNRAGKTPRQSLQYSLENNLIFDYSPQQIEELDTWIESKSSL